MGFLDSIMEANFWDNWESKFNLNGKRYLDPDEQKVRHTVEHLNIAENRSDIEVARDISDWISSNHKYELTKRWRKPEDTLEEGVGDCEDYTFLLASILPHFGIKKFDIVAGDARYSGNSEFHVWMELDGEVIDPTASSLQSETVQYIPELTFNIDMDNY